tara:strand:- start:290 stop:1075 length:786 start_codon:yes stop_codon:yes gene_type:complete
MVIEISLLLALVSITNLIPQMEILSKLTESEQTLQLNKFVAENLTKIVISTGLFILISFFFGASMASFKFTLFKEAVQQKKRKLIETFKESKKFYWRLVKLRILTFLIFLIALIVATVVLSLLNALLNAITSQKILTVLSILLLAPIFLSIYFRNAALYLDNLTSTKSLKQSGSFFLKNKTKVTLIVLIIILISLIPFKIEEYIGRFSVILMLLISIWSNLFIFNLYFQSKTSTKNQPIKNKKPTANKKKITKKKITKKRK